MAGTLQLLADNETEMKFLSKNHCLVEIKNVATRFLLLPVEEKAELCRLRIIVGNETVQAMNVRLAVDQIDYFVPVDLGR